VQVVLCARLVQLRFEYVLYSQHDSVLAAQADKRPDTAMSKARSEAQTYPLVSTALDAYSTWKTRPAGENIEAERSY
jgi:hypothetical protein